MKETKTTVNTVNDNTTTTRISNKEYQKARRKAIRAKRANAKKRAKEAKATEPKRYDILAQYNPVMKDMVNKILEENSIKVTIKSDTYFVCTDKSQEEYDSIKKMFEKCTYPRGEGKVPFHVSFSGYKSKTIIKSDSTPHSHTGNTTEVARAAKAARKANKALPRHQKSAYAQGRNTLKKEVEVRAKEGREPIIGRNAKKLTFRAGKHNFKSTASVTPGLKENNLEKKRRQRALKAGKYIVKQEQKKAVSEPIKAKNKASKKPKAVQQNLPLAALC